MNTTVYSACCGCEAWSKVINAIPGICWGIIVLVFILIATKYVFSPLIANWHIRETQRNNHDFEKDPELQEAKVIEQEARLNQRIREFESIELNKLLLGKISKAEDIKQLKDSLEKLNKEFEDLKKQLGGNTVTLKINQDK